MKILTAFLCSTLVLCFANVNYAQTSIFGGQGIGSGKKDSSAIGQNGNSWANWNQMQPQAKEKKGISWPKLGLFNNRKTGEEPGMDLANESRPKLFQGLPRMFPQKDLNEPDQPGMFGNFGQNSRNFFMESGSNFSNWARETNAKLKERTQNTWDNITNGFQRPLGGLNKPQAPPVRSAQNMDDQPRVRFD